MQTTNQLPQITLAALASINSAAFSETAKLDQAREAANLVLDSYELSSGEFVNMTWQPNGALFRKLNKIGVNHSQAFVEALHIIAYSELKRHTKETKRAAACIYWRLVEAAEKHAANEQAAHDAEMAAIAQHPAIAPVVAACKKSRELIIELADCNETRFFEICNEIEAIGYSNEILPYALQNEDTKAAFDNYEIYINFTVSPFYDRQINWHTTNALKVAANRLDLFFMYNENGEFITAECSETQGYYAFRVLDNVIGWVREDEQPTPTTKPRELVELGNCLNAQIAASRTPVAVANNCSEFANVTNAAAAKGMGEGDYLDLYSEAGGELEFEYMQLEQVQDIYAAAKERDGDDDDKNSADELVEKFAKFIHNKMQERHDFFLQKIDGVGFAAKAFSYELTLHEQTKISLRVEQNGDCRLKHLCAGVNNGSVCSISFCAHNARNFDSFFCSKMERFFADILKNNL